MEKIVEIVFVGKHTVMSYVMTVLQLVNDGVTTVILKARGKLISKAVDIAEVTRNRFLTDAKIESVVIGTEKLTNDGVTRNVSTIDVTLSVPE